ncbi:MAG: S-layer homology domain-containing protein [Oscillibacter sp.]|nr:S-layer homology domain-containing protein [Oscillibacter sp.]
MLSKYLQSMGNDLQPPAQPVQFAGVDAMSQEGNDAFQILYQSGIFKGTSGLRMEPEGSTTRAQFVVLMHRLSVFAQG